MQKIADIRKDYKLQTLLENDVEANPFLQFDKWWYEAVKSEITEVNAMTLATATKQGIPSARIVLLKGYDTNGFVFYTNYKSQKGIEICENPNVCLVFFWKELERQVKIVGTINKTSEHESDNYFQSRPIGSQIGAWASSQSKVIDSRDVIENKLIQIKEQFDTDKIPRPSSWGGYIVTPTQIEFWQGRPNRLHDRIRYSIKNNKIDWQIERLSP